MPGNRVGTHRALMVIGNRQGAAGFGMGKGQTPVDAVNAAIGLGGGSWVDYVNDENQLFMTVKIQGDNSNELNEIAEAFMNWANFQTRFTKLSNDIGNWKGNLYEGETNLWIYNDGNYLRLALSNDLDFIINFLSDCSSEQCNTNF